MNGEESRACQNVLRNDFQLKKNSIFIKTAVDCIKLFMKFYGFDEISIFMITYLPKLVVIQILILY